MSEGKTFDPWATTTGLLESYTGKIVDAQFGFKPDYQNGQALLLMVDINTGDPEIGEGGIVSEQYPVGKGWDSTDGGKTAVHESGQDKNFNNASGIGLLLNSIIDAGGLGVLQATGCTPNQAACWVGGTYVFERKEFSGTMQDKTQRTWHRMLVTDVVAGGAVTAAPAPAASMPAPTPVPAPAAAAPAATQAAPAAPAATDGPELPPVLKAKLKALAVAADTHDAFIEAAFGQVPEVMSDPALEAAVANAAWYEGLKG